MSGVQVQEVPGNSLLLGEFEILRWYFVSDMKYYVAVNHKQRRLVVSIRGSVGVENYYRDALMHGVTPSTRYWPGAPTDSKVHTGFYTAAYMMLDEERPETRVSNIISYHLGQFPGYGVVITGHSLGAAVASLVALSLKLNPVQGVTSLELYTYGQPIVSNAIFADFLGEKLGNDVYVRSISSDDSVPYLQMNAWSLQEPKDTMRHPKQSDEVFFPRWYEPVAQLCHGMSDPLCSLNMYCKDRKWDRHSWLGGQRIGEGFCLLSKYPQVIKP
ncbi:MAG: Alpha/Beta hydrolase protein [Piptocephalis tieghemiana]|nr:MAG: Alpha/Beta hydrolase protein [Piptocephalis tieghemiana]